MIFTVDTNILVRAIMQDDPAQSPIATRCLQTAQKFAVPTPVLCELAWVLSRTYGYTRSALAVAIFALRDFENAILDTEAVDAGLAMLHAGGDFADGAVAHMGSRMGAPLFLSFDQKAVKLLRRVDRQAALPTEV
ncbi:type II toxin-antitoxin system VapC family toxin [Aerophototrophica crusticola]|uniref:Type II toxin-antitoxin system VapC family toxin n=1 Tax=Aerophototrophica crusticola TaxID=1709002 RepID=A0A858R523_9PROT|nr:type II toxin-antitoxin system VapC family toxin [Rhodospirillaceae bacterium B3]